MRVLTAGDHFGEIALIKNVTRTLSVRALTNEVKLLALSSEAFARILGSIRDYLQEDYQKQTTFLSNTAVDTV